MVVNREVIEARLAMLPKHVSDLRAISSTTSERYASDHILRVYVERTLQICAQICLDVGSHLVAELELGSPAGSREVLAAPAVLALDSVGYRVPGG